MFHLALPFLPFVRLKRQLRCFPFIRHSQKSLTARIAKNSRKERQDD